MAGPTATDPQRIVTVSATYGAAGSVIAPRLAQALGLNFSDRNVGSRQLTALIESHSAEEQAMVPPSRWLLSLARLASVIPGAPTPGTTSDNDIIDMRREGEQQLSSVIASGPVLILGRAAAVVLAGRPGAFHVRLDGPVEARVRRAAEIEHIDPAEARRRCDATDRLRSTYVRRLYKCDPADASLYHIVVDTTALAEDDAVQLLADAANAFWRVGSVEDRR